MFLFVYVLNGLMFMRRVLENNIGFCKYEVMYIVNYIV